MQALGARFDGDPRLLYYDLGIYGHWGEWHNGGLCSPEATQATKRALVDMQIDAFPRSRVLMNSGASKVDAFQQQAQLVTLGKQSGYRYVLNQLSYPSAASTGAAISITSQWSNQGVAPVYEPFQVVFELQLQGQSSVAWSWVSQLDLQQLLPAAQPQAVADQFFVPSHLAPGQYTLSLVVRDPSRSRGPLALAIGGANSSLRYPLGTIAIGQGSAGQSVFLPVVQR